MDHQDIGGGYRIQKERESGMTYLVWNYQQEEIGKRKSLAKRVGSWSNRRCEMGVWINILAFQRLNILYVCHKMLCLYMQNKTMELLIQTGIRTCLCGQVLTIIRH